MFPSFIRFPSSPKGIPFCLQISSNRGGRRGGEVPHCGTPGRASGAAVTWTEPWGQGPPSPMAVARSCHHAQAVPLVTSSAAGSSAGSLRVAGLISRTHLSREMGKSDNVGTERHEVPQRVPCKRQRNKSPLGTSLVPQQLCHSSTVLPKPQQCCGIVPALQNPAGKCTGGSKVATNPPEKEPGQELVLLEKLLAPQTSLG